MHKWSHTQDECIDLVLFDLMPVLFNMMQLLRWHWHRFQPARRRSWLPSTSSDPPHKVTISTTQQRRVCLCDFVLGLSCVRIVNTSDPG